MIWQKRENNRNITVDNIFLWALIRLFKPLHLNHHSKVLKKQRTRQNFAIFCTSLLNISLVIYRLKLVIMLFIKHSVVSFMQALYSLNNTPISQYYEIIFCLQNLLFTWFFDSVVAERSARRRITPPPRRSNISIRKSSSLYWNTTVLMTMARSIVWDVSAPLKSVVPVFSWLPILIVSTAVNADWPICSMLWKTNRLFAGIKITKIYIICVGTPFA